MCLRSLASWRPWRIPRFPWPISPGSPAPVPASLPRPIPARLSPSKGLDFSQILYQPEVPTGVGRFCTIAQDHGLDRALDNTILRKLCAPAIERKEKVLAFLPIHNVNRVVGTIVGSEITRRWGAEGLPADTIEIHFTGSAGQSFGAF